MMRALRLGNFKAFAELQHVPVRPLTLIYGANSAGKSSIIQSLALAHHAILTGDLDTHRTEIGGDSIDLGRFRQYVHRRDVGKRVEWAVDLDTAGLTGRLGELLASALTVQLSVTIGMGEVDESQPTFFGDFTRIRGPRVGVESCVIGVDDAPLLTMSARRGGLLRIDRLDQHHPVLREVLKAIILATTTTQDVKEEDFVGIDDAVDAMVPDITVRLGRFLPRMDARMSAEQETAQRLLVPVSKGNRPDSLAQAIRMFLPLSIRDIINGVSAAVETAVGQLRYLGPLRSYPPRHLAFSAHHDSNWHAGGGSSWDILRRDSTVRAAVNQWLSSSERLSTSYEVVVRDLLAFDQLDEPLLSAFEKLEDDGLDIQYEEESEYVMGGAYSAIKDVDEQVRTFKKILHGADIDRVTELVLMDRRRSTLVTHRDVGIGVSQVLPVVINAFGFREQLIAIEQPEIHLHPGLQAELGDVFIESALGDRRNIFVIETHSEHLLLRVMRRMRETAEGRHEGRQAVRPEDVMVLFVEPDGSRSIIHQMPLNERGELVKAWPGGFFEEGLKEIFC